MDRATGLTLEPLRAALRLQAEADARQRLADAAEQRDRILAEAQARARALIERARLTGERLAGAESQRRLAGARREAHELELAAQRSLVDELRRRVRDQAFALRGGPSYEALLERLQALARSQLGDHAQLTVDPPDRGGVIARRDSASVDYTLPALAERALDELAGRVEELWR